MLQEMQSHFKSNCSYFSGLYQFAMIAESKGHPNWSLEELKLLKELEPLYTTKKWKIISREFRQKGFIKSEIQCREKWVNFLDPKANKSKWEENELEHLYDSLESVGTRWCIIQKGLNRTQNSIKNRFYGSIRNFIRFLLGYFSPHRTCFNTEISKLSPKLLANLYDSEQAFEFLNGQPRRAIYEMKFVVNKRIMSERVRENKSIYHRLNQLILETFEENNNLSSFQIHETQKKQTEGISQKESPKPKNQRILLKKEQPGQSDPIERVDSNQSPRMEEPQQTNFPMFPWIVYQPILQPFGWYF